MISIHLTSHRFNSFARVFREGRDRPRLLVRGSPSEDAILSELIATRKQVDRLLDQQQALINMLTSLMPANMGQQASNTPVLEYRTSNEDESGEMESPEEGRERLNAMQGLFSEWGAVQVGLNPTYA
jgi:hypothetical protein